MKRRSLLSGLLAVACLAAIWVVFAQRRQIIDLRAEEQRLLAEQATAPEITPATSLTTVAASSELLRLRNELGRVDEKRVAVPVAH